MSEEVLLVGRGGGRGGGALGISDGWNPSNMEGGFAGRSSPFPPFIVGKLAGQCFTQTAAFSFNFSTSASVRWGMDLIHRFRSSLIFFFLLNFYNALKVHCNQYTYLQQINSTIIKY